MSNRTKVVIKEIILEEIRKAIDSVAFGAVTIKVHDGKVVQIEITNKQRFEELWRFQDGDGI